MGWVFQKQTAETDRWNSRAGRKRKGAGRRGIISRDKAEWLSAR
jgi:hypothetical protein